MSVSCRCSRAPAQWGGCLFLLLLGTTHVASAEETGNVKLFPFATAAFENKESELDAGIEVQASCLRSRILFRTPVVKGEKPPLVNLTEDTDTWRIVGSIQCELDSTQATGPAQLHRFGIDAEWGRSPFSFFPGRQEEKSTVHRSAHAFKARYLYYFGANQAGFQMAPQLYLRTEKSFTAGDTEYFLSPTADDPDRVRAVVVDAPTSKRLWTARIAMPLYPGWEAPFAFGPALSYGVAGDLFDGDAARFRAELWGYVFAMGKKDGKDTSVRIGASPFMDTRTAGSDTREKTEYGVLLQLRIGTSLLEY